MNSSRGGWKNLVRGLSTLVELVDQGAKTPFAVGLDSNPILANIPVLQSSNSGVLFCDGVTEQSFGYKCIGGWQKIVRDTKLMTTLSMIDDLTFTLARDSIGRGL